MKYTWAVPGARVVCVKEFDTLSGDAEEYPVVGKRYTIRDTDPHPGNLWLRFKEISNRLAPTGGEPSFGAWYFRPLTERTQDQDIELFRKIADEAPVMSPNEAAE